jgi:NAD(P)-dependent dehydrogenase (short-subunit alcohol dehydrogenase family)
MLKKLLILCTRSMKLKNKNIIITGGSQGLGKEIAKYCLIEGASVAICARDTKTLNEAYNELQQYKQQNQTFISKDADISNNEESRGFVRYCIDHFRKIDVLINNAGIHGSKNTIDDPEFDYENWINAISVNLIGTVNMCLAVVPYLKQNRHGKIINLSGGGATSPMPGMSAYASSKAAIVRFTETIALELKRYNIDVNAVAPGAMNTRLLDDVLNNGNGKVTNEYYDKLLRQKETGGTPLSVGAELCVYLASDESDGITGKLISAVWDDWKNLHKYLKELDSDIYTLRRIIPEDRGITLGYL